MFREVSIPHTVRSSVSDEGGGMSVTYEYIFSGSRRIPDALAIFPKNLTSFCFKWHLDLFSFSPDCLIFSKTPFNLLSYPSSVLPREREREKKEKKKEKRKKERKTRKKKRRRKDVIHDCFAPVKTTQHFFHFGREHCSVQNTVTTVIFGAMSSRADIMQRGRLTAMLIS